MKKFEVAMRLLLIVFLALMSSLAGMLSGTVADTILVLLLGLIAVLAFTMAILLVRSLILKSLASTIAEAATQETDEDYKPALKQAYAEYTRRFHIIKALMEDEGFTPEDYAEAEQMAQDAIKGVTHEDPVS